MRASAFTRAEPDMYRYVVLMIATAVRPEAAMAFDPDGQWDAERQTLDLHPSDWPRTKKVNPVVPAIGQLIPVLEAWKKDGAKRVASRKTAWRTMRRALGLGEEVVAKTIRHTVATRLRTMGVPGEQIETLMGHRTLKRTTAVYAKYDPDYLSIARHALAKLFTDVTAAADEWSAGHLRAKVGNGLTIVTKRETAKTLGEDEETPSQGG